jgi:mRNA interferase YafQ
MLTPSYTKQFLKDVKKLKASGRKDMERLYQVIGVLVEEKPLEQRHRNHPLKGAWKGYEACCPSQSCPYGLLFNPAFS